MKQQSEHLSNAQIEQYGKRASGAGPETEAWVEQHLDDCPSCRNRVLDFQRTRFALFPDPKVNKVSSSDCSSEDDLRNLAAGLYPDPKAAQLKAHAATCDHCGPLLQEYIEDFSDESSPEEQAFLNQLRTASPEFRQQKAREMFEREILKKNPVIPEPVPAADWRRFLSWKWILIPATAVIALAAIIFPVYLARRDTPEKAEKLLAQAYSNPRTIEMRWPGAAHAPLTEFQRGANDPKVPRPTALLDAENAIGHALEKSPSNSEWLRLHAQSYLLEHDPSSAITVLDSAREPNADSPSTILGLAIAHFVQGQDSSDTQEYKQAVKLLNKLLERQPENTVALFNRAIVYEHLHMYLEAAADWNAVLLHETDEGWRTEAQEHLKRLQEKKTPG